MRALTLPGWPIAAAVHGAFLGAAAAATPPGRGRRIALPGVFLLQEIVRWRWPFGGVPLSHLALGQVGGPLGPVARIGGEEAVVLVAIVAGLALSALLDRTPAPYRLAGALAAFVVAVVVLGSLGPHGRATGSLRVALVQGGGEQGTTSVDTDPKIVFDRHVAASSGVLPAVDLVVWPEDVIDVEGPFVGSDQRQRVLALADGLDTEFLVGVTEGDGDRFRNYVQVVPPDGECCREYQKRKRVPFGEFVPFRGLIDSVAPEYIAARDAVPGDGPPLLEAGGATHAVAISWEVFFGYLVRDGLPAGEIVLNPTNGSSFQGTIVQSQQVAASRLRALESGRWVLQVGPTGFSAVISPDGEVRQRTAIGERRVLHATVETRAGETWAILVDRSGALPLLFAGLAAAGWIRSRARSGGDMVSQGASFSHQNDMSRTTRGPRRT